MQATRIIAIRHGETDWNRASRMQGHLDVPLNAHGQWQARQTARALAGESVAAVYSSDLQRASATARAIAQACGAPLVLDAEAVNRNMQRMAEFAAKHQIKLRPHAKLHKSADIARLQMQAGAIGVCVQTVGEGEALAAGGVNDIFISNEIVSPAKLRRVAGLAQLLKNRSGRLAIAVDSDEGIDRLALAMQTTSAAIDVFIEIDVGQGRCGVAPGPAAVALVQRLQGSARLRYAGLHAYHGGAQHLRTVAERRNAIGQAALRVAATRDALAQANLAPAIITGGGTGTFGLEAASGLWNELQPGSFLFMDADYARNERDNAQPAFEQALFVKSQVISVQDGHAVCDAGCKSIALDSGPPLVHALPGQPALIYASGGDEHGILRPATAGGPLPAVGDTVWLIPSHCDPTVNLHDAMIAVQGGLAAGAVSAVVRVDARGA